MELITCRQGLQKIAKGSDKGVLIANGMAGLPEARGIGMIWAGDEQIAPALCGWSIGSVEELQAVHVFEIECQAALCRVDLKAMPVAPANAEAAGFESPDAAVSKTRQQHHRIIHLSIGNEGVSGGVEFGDLTV